MARGSSKTDSHYSQLDRQAATECSLHQKCSVNTGSRGTGRGAGGWLLELMLALLFPVISCSAGGGLPHLY